MTPAEFVIWCVHNWRYVITTQFSWMREKPAPMFPDIGFLATYANFNRFLEAYAVRREREHAEMAPGEAGEYLRLTQSGMTHDDALIQIGKGRVLREEREKLLAAREHMRRTVAAVRADAAAEARMRQALTAAPSTPLPPIGTPVRLVERPTLHHTAPPLDFDALTDLPDWQDRPWS